MTSALPIESPEIAGVPTELLEQFSKRTAEVDRALATKLAEPFRVE